MLRITNIPVRRQWVFTAALALAPITASSSGAQPLPKIYDSVEWMAVTSPIIVLGTIKNIDPRPNRYARITMDVSESMKGAKTKSVSFVMRIGDIYRYAAQLRKLENWKKRDTEILLFLGHDYSRYPQVTQKEIKYESRGAWSPAHYAALFGKNDKTITRGLWTMDLQSIKNYAHLVAHTRTSIKDAQQYKPWDSMKTTTSRQAKLEMEYVRMPIDARLEKLAKRWIRSNDEGRQQTGAYALYHFPSTENRKFVETVQKDAGKGQRKLLSDLLNQWQADERIDLSRLISTMANVDQPYQWNRACRILGSRGANAKSAIPALEKFARSSNPLIRIAAAETIKEIQADTAKDP